MNYAATLAVMVVLAFCFPLTLRLGAGFGVSQTITISVLGALLLRLDRRREAAETIDRYARLGGARESEIVALQEALSRANRRQRRAQGREA